MDACLEAGKKMIPKINEIWTGPGGERGMKLGKSR